MGNTTSASIASTAAIESFLKELGPDFYFDKPIGNSRFLKTIRGRRPSRGRVVIKMYLKPQEPSSNIEFSNFISELQKERELLAKIPNVLPYSSELETSNCLFITRPYLFCSLYDRVSLRPFLSQAEKKWITYQLLVALRDAHSSGVCHGDIKSENVLMTTFNWVYLTDFASFKPTLLPEDDPADFAFYFDSSSRRNCYIAPERFVASTESRDQRLTKQMDMFSLGCVIAELFLEGTVLFSFSQLLSYRSGNYSPQLLLGRIEDKDIRSMVQHMIQKDPESRYDASKYLEQWKHAFPTEYSSFMHDYVFSLSTGTKRDSINRSDFMISSIYHDFEQVSKFFNLKKIDLQSDHHFSLDCYRPVDETGSEGALILLTIVSSALRNTSRPCFKIMGLELILVLSKLLRDRYRLDRCVPFCMSMFKDGDAKVRALALRVTAVIMSSVQEVTAIDANIFIQYVMPQCQLFTEDSSTLVRIAYASMMARLAETSRRFLEIAYLNTDSRAKDNSDKPLGNRTTYDGSLMELQELFEDHLVKMLTDSCSQVKVTFLKNIAELCLFLGKQKTHDILLSHVITYLNDPDPILRLAFFESAVPVGTFLGSKNVEQYVLPLLIQGLHDVDENVSERALLSLKSLVNLGFFSRFKLRELVRLVSSFMIHSNSCIRNAAVLFISSCSRQLSNMEIMCFIMPLLRSFLKFPISDLSESALSAALINPIEKKEFNRALQEAEKSLVETTTGSDAYLNRTLSLDHSDFMKRLDDCGMSDEVQGKMSLIISVVERIALNMHKPTWIKHDVEMYTVELVKSPKTVFLPVADSKDTSASLLNPHFRAASLPSGGGNMFSLNKTTQRRLSKAEPYVSQSMPTPSSDLVRSVSSVSQFMKPQGLLQTQDSSRALPSLITTVTVATVESERQKENDVKSPTAYIKSSEDEFLNTLSEGNSKTSESYVEYVFEEAIGRIMEDKVKETSQAPKFHVNRIQSSPVKLQKKQAKTPANAPNMQTWTPSSCLVATFHEHTKPITGMRLSPDQLFFATSSEDGSLRIWDCQRLEKNVTDKSRLQYSTENAVAIKCLQFLDASHCIAIGLEDGAIDIIRVFVTPSVSSPPKYSQCQRIKRIMLSDDEYAIGLNHVNYDSKSLLIISTSKSFIYMFDLSSEKILWKHKVPYHYGMISGIDVDHTLNNWIVAGTRRGVIICLDLRFGFVFRQWQHPLKSPVTALKILPSTSKHRRLLCACGDNELSVWDIEKLACKEILIASQANVSIKIAKYAKQYKQLPSLPKSQDLPDEQRVDETLTNRIFGLHYLLTSGQILSAGTDMRIRIWNMASQEKSISIGRNDGHDRQYKAYQSEGMVICQENAIKSALAKQTQQLTNASNSSLSIGVILGEDYTKRPVQSSEKSRQMSPVEERYYYHSDCITHLEVTETPYPMLISASRDGSVKVWK